MTNKAENAKLHLQNVSISSLIEKADAENKDNRRKMFSNLNKPTKDIEPYDNTHFLNMISVVNDALN